MCLLINQPKNTARIDTGKLSTAYDSNPDGVGFAYGDGKRVHILKFRDLKSFLSEYKKTHKTHGKKSDFVLHFRWKTHGMNKGTFNVHPFEVNNSLAFAHNGVIHKVDDDKKLSDTQVFNRDILRPLKLKSDINPVIVKLLAEYIGTGNKLAFVNKYGESKIVNESAGHWNGGAWYSNHSYESYGACYSNPNYGGVNLYNYPATNKKKTEPATLSIKQNGYCNSCGTSKPKSELSHVKHMGGYWYAECKECSKYWDDKDIEYAI